MKRNGKALEQLKRHRIFATEVTILCLWISLNNFWNAFSQGRIYYSDRFTSGHWITAHDHPVAFVYALVAMTAVLSIGLFTFYVAWILKFRDEP
jgi:hypothetical protein